MEIGVLGTLCYRKQRQVLTWWDITSEYRLYLVHTNHKLPLWRKDILVSGTGWKSLCLKLKENNVLNTCLLLLLLTLLFIADEYGPRKTPGTISFKENWNHWQYVSSYLLTLYSREIQIMINNRALYLHFSSLGICPVLCK